MKKIALCMALSFVLASPAIAATASPGGDASTDCTSQPTCVSMGYSTDATCDNGSFIYCPYDISYKKCIPSTSAAIDCEAEGFTTEDKTSWCSKVVKCSANNNYTLCAKNITCGEGEALIGADCQPIYASCSAANLLSYSECNTTGYTCGLARIIYTSADGTTATCYSGKIAKSCPAGYTTGTASSCTRTMDGGTCSNGYILMYSTDYYSGDTACSGCTCKLELNKPSTGCNCTQDKPYYVNGVCRADCPGHAIGQECFMCAVLDEYVREDGESCPGGANGSICACTGLPHTGLGAISAHMCTR